MKKLISRILFLLVLIFFIFIIVSKNNKSTNKIKVIKNSKSFTIKKIKPVFKYNNQIFDKTKLSKGVVLVAVEGTMQILLLDSNGNQIHKWENIDATRAKLLSNGNLFVVYGTKWGMKDPYWENIRNYVRIYDPEGNIVWEYKADDIAHHDFTYINENEIYLLLRDIVPFEKNSSIKDKLRRSQEIRADRIIKINEAGDIKWDWRAYEHLDLNSCGNRGCVEVVSGQEKALKRLRDWTHINTLSIMPENKWYDSGDSRFKPGNIITLPRNWWTVLVIDKDTKKTVWDYSGDYRGGVSGGHDAQMIEKGYPGAGNILIFDNGRKLHNKESIILEVDPVTKKLIWKYEAGKAFYSESRGAVQRLKNGNTLISEDQKGRCFEVDSDSNIVWSFNPGYQINRCKKYETVPKYYLNKISK